MINLMYLVFIAMMALNVSSEVLDGFELVEGSLRKSIDNSSQRNQLVADELEAYFKDNPQKVGEWAMKGRMVKKASDSLYNYIQDLKVQIVNVACHAETAQRRGTEAAESHRRLPDLDGQFHRRLHQDEGP